MWINPFTFQCQIYTILASSVGLLQSRTLNLGHTALIPVFVSSNVVCNFSNLRRKKRNLRGKRPRESRMTAPLPSSRAHRVLARPNSPPQTPAMKAKNIRLPVAKTPTVRRVEWRFDERNNGFPIIYLNFNNISLSESGLHMYCRFTTWISLNATFKMFTQ